MAIPVNLVDGNTVSIDPFDAHSDYPNPIGELSRDRQPPGAGGVYEFATKEGGPIVVRIPHATVTP